MAFKIYKGFFGGPEGLKKLKNGSHAEFISASLMLVSAG